MTDEEYYEFIRPYEDAKQMLLTRLDVLNHNLYGEASARPIHNIQCRIKKKRSIEEKLRRKGKEETVINAKDYLQDIAGVRVICYFVDDIYNLTELLKSQSDLILGAILGIAVPQATGIAILGDVFVSALKAIAPLLVFFLVISSLCNAGKSHGGVIKTVIILYMFSTVLAAVIAVFASMAFPVKLTLANAATDTSAPQGIAEVLNNLLLNVVANPVSSLVNANYVGILMWAVLLGLAFRAADKMTKKVLADVADGISMVVTWIINLAPVGIFGLVFNTVSTNGLDIFTTYGKLLVLLVGCMLFIYFVTNPILVYWCIRQNPYPLIFHCLKRSALTAFFTRSSAANIPVNMKVCEEMGLDRDTYSVTIPLGATINMDGAAITITVMTMATAFTLGINVDIPTAIILSLLAALSACGASGVAGGSLLLIPLACSLFGISDDIAMQVVAVGFIIGVIQDSVETALNSSSDLLLSASAEFRQWRLEGKEIKFK
jgi:serine/threonine transporter